MTRAALLLDELWRRTLAPRVRYVRYVRSDEPSYGAWKLQVRVLWVWWTLAYVTRYAVSDCGSVVSALLDSVYQRATEPDRPMVQGPYGFYRESPKWRVAIIPKGSDIDKEIGARVARTSAERAAGIFEQAGIGLKNGEVVLKEPN